jgi:tricorn protease
MRRHLFLTALPALALLIITENHAHLATLGYYRFPAIWHDTIVFTAEGDLWRVKTGGGLAERLTTHPALESNPAVSPDGTVVAFSANYEGPTEVYTISLNGGTPERQTWDGEEATVVGWTKASEILYSTSRFSTLPNAQIARIDPRTHARTLVPLAQASDGDFDETGATLFFTRLPFQGSHTRRYRGGTAQAIWKYTGDGEAVPLTADYTGTSRRPMVWKGRVYFLSDRDGVMNLWSMDTNGQDLRQHTKYVTYDVQSPSLSEGRVAYQLGADLHVYDITADRDETVPISLVSDFDQLRERWIKDPGEWITAAHISPTGDRVAITARGQLFVIPAGQGRIVETARNKAVRYREARFFADGKSLLALSDESSEVEFWKVPANGVGKGVQLTRDAKVLRWDGTASPDGKLIAHFDKDQQLWVYDIERATEKRLAVSANGDFGDVRWAPDSQWLAYTAPEPNQLTRLWLYGVKSGASTPVTSDRYDSYSPAWSPDGKWLYFLSDRHFDSIVRSPWGSRQPEPFFDRSTQIFQVSLTPGQCSPVMPDDELYVAPKEEEKDSDKGKDDKGKDNNKDKDKDKVQTAAPASPAPVDLRGIETRLLEVPVPPGNYRSLDLDGKRLYFMSYDTAVQPKGTLETFPIASKKAEVEAFQSDVKSYELSLDRKKVMVRTAKDIYVVDAAAKAPPELAKSAIPLKDWAFSFDPREEWHQMFDEAWRLERDYFYDRGMHGLDWSAIRAKYLPLVDRVTDRSELSDALAQMVSELSALHIFVTAGDVRHGPDAVQLASLGATFVRDQGAGGLRVSHIYRSDPDRPDRLAPLARAGVEVAENDVITTVNGISTLSVSDLGQLVRNQAGKQVLLEVKAQGTGNARQVVVVPISMNAEQELRYDEWEYTRRLAVEKATDSHVGYIHLRAMGPANMAEWEREFYPVFTRDGLIIDVRHNSGGNIDSWVLEKLVRKAWFYWQPRVGHPFWNMQGAFRGHIVVLCNEFTASDGEAFAEGFRRLGLGAVIGTRTWGGEIWLSASNRLVDKGIATAAELGVYGPEGDWLIEGHGVDPDISVDNPPHAAFGGSDPQLDRAIAHLKDEIARNPVTVPPAPEYPNKAWPPPTGKPAKP